MRTLSYRQKAVWWGSPTPDGRGGRTFAAPVEIACRWEERQELFVDARGQEVRSRAVVYPASVDLVLDGYLWHGELADLSAAQKADPQIVSGALPVRGWGKSPDLRGRAHARKAWL